jgi:excisionase family DNA binding protein
MHLLTTSEVAMLLNVSDRTVRRWCMEGRMRHLRTPVRRIRPRRILIPEDAVKEFIEKYGSSILASRKKRRARSSYTLRQRNRLNLDSAP